jgi:iron(III) transport system ATP-binding protein
MPRLGQAEVTAMVDVSLVGISKRFGDGEPVLQDIDLHVAAGELFFLLGPSGCGKTTLLRLVAGFLQPDRGEIRLGGENVAGLPAERRDCAMVFQSYALWPHLSVLANVSFGLEVRGIPAAERRERALEALALVGLESLADRRVPSLSGGQQQRVALARAVVVRPRVLLLDEPLSNLDAKLRVSMRTEIRRICKSAGLTTLYVTHDQKEALSMADRLAVLDHGTLQQIGAPHEVYRRPTSRAVAEFIGAANFVSVRVTACADGGVTVRGPLGALRSAAPGLGLAVGDAATALLRPEALRVVSGCDVPNTFEATVTGGVFLGEIGQWDVQVGEVELQVAELNAEPRAAGSRIALCIAPEDLVILAE